MNAIQQLLEQTDLTAYRLSKHTGVSTQLIHYTIKRKSNTI